MEVEQDAGSLRAAAANAMAGLKAKHYGKGPTGAKAFFGDDNLFVVLEGGLTANEEALLADGKEHVVRSYRLEWQETMGPTAIAMIEEIVGRKVLTYHSQIVFGPARAMEWFVLAPED